MIGLLVTTSSTSGASTATESSSSASVSAKSASGSSTAAKSTSSASVSTEATSGTTTATEATSGTATATESTSSTAGRLFLWFYANWGSLGQESFQGQQLVWPNVELVPFLKGVGLDTVGGLDGEKDLVQGTQDLVDLTNLALVLQVDWGVEVRNPDVYGATDNVAFTSLHERTHFQNGVWGSLLKLGWPGSATAASSESTSTSVHC